MKQSVFSLVTKSKMLTLGLDRLLCSRTVVWTCTGEERGVSRRRESIHMSPDIYDDIKIGCFSSKAF